MDRHIKPYLGEKIISHVIGKDVQKLYDTLARHGNRITGEGLSSVTTLNTYSHVTKQSGGGALMVPLLHTLG